jgi:hypothetical protein
VLIPAGCGGANATCYQKSAAVNGTAAACRIAGFTPAALAPQALETAPVGSVTPQGWLAAELRVVAGGLMGALPHFWPDIANSTFIGGKADGGLHERAPYWLNGLVPASYLTGDANLVALRESYLGYIVDHQAPSGWIGPDDLAADGNQYWGRMNVVLSLLQHYEGSGDARAVGGARSGSPPGSRCSARGRSPDCRSATRSPRSCRCPRTHAAPSSRVRSSTPR